MAKVPLPPIILVDDQTALQDFVYQLLLLFPNEIQTSKRLGISRNTLRSIKMGKTTAFVNALLILSRLGYSTILPKAQSDDNQATVLTQTTICLDIPVYLGNPFQTEAYKSKIEALTQENWEILNISTPTKSSGFYKITFTVKKCIVQKANAIA